MSFSKMAKGHSSGETQEPLVTLVLVGQPSVIKVSLITTKCGKTLWVPAGPGQYPPFSTC